MPEKKVVKVFSTPTCPYCKMAKEWMKENNIEFSDVDVSTDEKAAAEMTEKSGQMGVPVIAVGDEVIVGFDKPKLEELLLN